MMFIKKPDLFNYENNVTDRFSSAIERVRGRNPHQKIKLRLCTCGTRLEIISEISNIFLVPVYFAIHHEVEQTHDFIHHQTTLFMDIIDVAYGVENIDAKLNNT